MNVSIPQPSELGLDSRFDPWRSAQETAFHSAITAPTKVWVGALPTGTGKSLLGVGLAQFFGEPTVILTSTKGLMDQYARDFGAAGVVDVRGMANYPCRALGLTGANCSAGPCLDADPCEWKQEGCAYFDTVKRGAAAKIVVTNYAWWFKHRFDRPLGSRPVVVCDEAHTLVEEVASAVGVEFHKREVELVEPMGGWALEQWQAWARERWEKGTAVLAAADANSLSGRERRDLRNLVDRFKRLMVAVDWAWDFVPGKFVRFEPVSPAAFVESYLFQGAGRVVLLSATIRPSALVDLGLASTYTFHEAPSPFPAYRRPIHWIKTGVRLNYNATKLQLEFHARMIDAYIAKRLDRKGIIHTVSYARAQWLKEHSQFAGALYVHTGADTAATVEAFKRAEPPAILVSPSVHTGWDFPYEQAAWQIIAKIPFPDTRSGIAAARQARDRTYSLRAAATTVVQMAGRIVRAADDAGETAIIDDTWEWFYNHNRHLFPQSFREALNTVTVAPAPMPLRSAFDLDTLAPKT